MTIQLSSVDQFYAKMPSTSIKPPINARIFQTCVLALNIMTQMQKNVWSCLANVTLLSKRIRKPKRDAFLFHKHVVKDIIIILVQNLASVLPIYVNQINFSLTRLGNAYKYPQLAVKTSTSTSRQKNASLDPQHASLLNTIIRPHMSVDQTHNSVALDSPTQQHKTNAFQYKVLAQSISTTIHLSSNVRRNIYFARWTKFMNRTPIVA